MTTPARETINLSELEKRADFCIRAPMGLLLDPDVVLRLVAALREIRGWGTHCATFLAEHGITDEAGT